MTSTLKYVLLGIAILLPCNLAFPILRISAHRDEDTNEMTIYLDHYYPDDKKLHHSIKERLEMMQKFFHLHVTGTMDDETKRVMKQPRCGVPDVSEYKTMDGNPKWDKNIITYRINNYTPDLPPATIEQTIKRAFQLWADVTPLTFIKAEKEPADIEIWFARRAHGDFNPFDGPGGTLAHAFGPVKGSDIGGDAHFDEDEKWSEYNTDVNLFLVAAHEFGHSLGMDHSSEVGALMYPTYDYRNPDNYTLPDDDKKGIQSLYGGKDDGHKNNEYDYDDQADYYC